jgi:hypothetical protein
LQDAKQERFTEMLIGTVAAIGSSAYVTTPNNALAEALRVAIIAHSTPTDSTTIS